MPRLVLRSKSTCRDLICALRTHVETWFALQEHMPRLDLRSKSTCRDLICATRAHAETWSLYFVCFGEFCTPRGMLFCVLVILLWRAKLGVLRLCYHVQTNVASHLDLIVEPEFGIQFEPWRFKNREISISPTYGVQKPSFLGFVQIYLLGILSWKRVLKIFAQYSCSA